MIIMVRQKPISLKINTELLKPLDYEVTRGWHKRNWHINQSIKIYLELQACRRLYNIVETEVEKKEAYNSWMRRWFPEAVIR